MAGGKKLLGMSQAAFAREMGVTPNAIRDRVKRGSLAEAVLPDGSIDAVAGRVAWFANSNPSRMKKKPPVKRSALFDDAQGAAESTEYDLKVKRMAVDLQAAEINLEKLKRSSIDLDEARRMVRAFARLHRDAMLNFANRYGPAIAAVVSVPASALVAEMDARMRDALNEALDAPVPFDAEAVTVDSE